MVTFCDSTNFSNALLQKNTKCIQFVSKMLTNGISSNFYLERAELIADGLNPKLEILQNDITILICDITAVEVQKQCWITFLQ